MLHILRPPLLHLGIHLPDKFWFNYQVSSFIAQVVAASVYVIVSLITCRKGFNLDRMLHRGQFALSGEAPKTRPLRERFRLGNVFRFDENFTLGDKILSSSIFWWAMALVAVNLVILAWNFLWHWWPARWWANYWLILAILLPFGVSLVTLIWFTFGGIRDMRLFFTALRDVRRDSRDDGRVIAHHNLADEKT